MEPVVCRPQGTPIPEAFSRSVFLAGPMGGDAPWRSAAADIIRSCIRDEAVSKDESWVVFDPTAPVELTMADRTAWEQEAMGMADIIIFWVPQSKEEGSGLATRVELGSWLRSGKCVLGWEEGAKATEYLDVVAQLQGDPWLLPTAEKEKGSSSDKSTTLDETIRRGVKRLLSIAQTADPASLLRRGGERSIPLELFLKPEVQAWRSSQVGVGNRIDKARVEWTLRVGPKRLAFLYVIYFDVFIASEDRHKTNEVVVFRSDSSSVVLYRRGATPVDAEVVLVREYRTPVRNAAGAIYELPGGSSWNSKDTPEQVALEEAEEEAGISLTPDRLVPLGGRQIAGTLGGHVCNGFSVEMTEEEMATVKKAASDKTVFGVAEDTERTTLHVATVSSILRGEPPVDWSNLGLILAAINTHL